MKTIATVTAIAFTSLWLTPDQQGQRLFKRGEFAAAAEHFRDPMWKATALFRAGEFKQAQAVFARLDSPEAQFNRGNSLVFQGLYQDAIASYDRALESRPDWKEAQENRDIAVARAEKLKTEGGDMGDQKLGADEIVFDKKNEGGQETDVTGDKGGAADSMQELWLRRVQTRPADFLKNKFAYQKQFGEEEPK